MNDAGHILHGHCLCGEVKLTVRSETLYLRACHCDMCRRHTSGMYMSLDTIPGTLTVEGPAQSYVSSDWAERGFCGTCGSTLWYGLQADGMRHPAAGLFDDAAGGKMKMEFFSDRCPSGYALAGDHSRLNTKETIAMFTDDGEST